MQKKQEIMAHNQENNQFLRNINNMVRGEKIYTQQGSHLSMKEKSKAFQTSKS